jgi:hypothetical protein
VCTKGTQWLRDPATALPTAPGASTTASSVAATLMAIVDAVREQGEEAGAGAGAEAGAGEPSGASGKGGPKPKGAAGSLGKPTREPEEVFRYDTSTVNNGWSTNYTDSIVFRVDQDCMLMGMGVFGAASPCTTKSWVCEGKTTTGDKVADPVELSIESVTNEVHKAMLPTPVRLTADTDYCFTDRIEGPGYTWYANGSKDPAGTVVLDCGITVTHHYTGDPSHTSTTPTRGRCAALYILPLSAFKREDVGEGEGGEALGVPLPHPKALYGHMDTEALSSLIRITRWAVGTLGRGDSAMRGTSTSGAAGAGTVTVRRAAQATLVFALRLLRFSLADAGLAPRAPTPVEEGDGGGNDSDGEGAKDPKAPKAAAQGTPKPWVDPDPTVYATALWDVDAMLRQVLATPGLPGAVVQAALDTCTALVNTLYPTWRLKHAALGSLVGHSGLGASGGAAGGSSGDVEPGAAAQLVRGWPRAWVGGRWGERLVCVCGVGG